LELPIIWASVFIPVQIGHTPNAGPVWARTFGLGMTILILICSAVNIFLAFILAS